MKVSQFPCGYVLQYFNFGLFSNETLETNKRLRTFSGGGVCTLKPVHAGRDYILDETISPLMAAARRRCLFTHLAETEGLTTLLHFLQFFLWFLLLFLKQKLTVTSTTIK